MLYFTSDLHLGHANAIRHSNRPFADVEEMNRVLIENINNAVAEPEDELWILGDFSVDLNKEEVRALRKRIACRHVHLIKGNHDKDYAGEHIFQSVQPYKRLKTAYGPVILFHYPILEWEAAQWGTIHLHGHIHSMGDYNKDNLNRKLADRVISHHIPKGDFNLRLYDVGVDATGFRPVSIDQIAKVMGLVPAHQDGE